MRAWRPEVFLLGATADGYRFAPRLAARLRTGLSAHCIDLSSLLRAGCCRLFPGGEAM